MQHSGGGKDHHRTRHFRCDLCGFQDQYLLYFSGS